MTAPRISRPVRTVAPAADLLTTDEVKAQTRIDAADEDALLATYVAAATSHLDGYGGILGRALITQSWSVNAAGFSGDEIRLPLGDLIAVTSVSYRDVNGAAQTLSSANYSAGQDDGGPYLRLVSGASWPATAERDDAVTVVWQAGYGATSASVPASIKHAAILLASHWYEQRAAVGSDRMGPIPFGVDPLIAPHRVHRI